MKLDNDMLARAKKIALLEFGPPICACKFCGHLAVVALPPHHLASQLAGEQRLVRGIRRAYNHWPSDHVCKLVDDECIECGRRR